jgi:hypothetical protein
MDPRRIDFPGFLSRRRRQRGTLEFNSRWRSRPAAPHLTAGCGRVIICPLARPPFPIRRETIGWNKKTFPWCCLAAITNGRQSVSENWRLPRRLLGSRAAFCEPLSDTNRLLAENRSSTSRPNKASAPPGPPLPPHWRLGRCGLSLIGQQCGDPLLGRGQAIRVLPAL